MAKIKVVGDAVVVTSNVEWKAWQQIAKLRPEGLILREFVELDGGGEGNVPVFRVVVADGKPGSLDSNGAVFGRANADGFATITEVFRPEPGKDVREAVADRYGTGLLRLMRLESSIRGILDDIDGEISTVMDQIEVIG